MNWESVWYKSHPLSHALRPLAAVTRWVSTRRRQAALAGWEGASSPFKAKVVILGNLTVGGTGKTPLVGHLAIKAREAGWRVGIVSRGYGGVPSIWPRRVTENSLPEVVGDEPLMLHKQARVPVAVCVDRPKAVECLIQAEGCDLILSDDGLQHYPLWRDLEILVIDGARQFGNGRLLPAGPLREPLSRLDSVDWVVQRGGAAHPDRLSYNVEAVMLRNLLTEQTLPLHGLNQAGVVNAVAGIGHPEQFFAQLEAAGYTLNRIALPDHYDYRASLTSRLAPGPVLLTDKDAVKAGAIAGDNTWVVEASVFAPELTQRWLSWLAECKKS